MIGNNHHPIPNSRGPVAAVSWISTTIMLDPQTRWHPTDGSTTAGRTVLVFPDRGLRRRTAVEMMETAPTFAEYMHRCHTAFADLVDWSLFDTLHRRDAPSRIDVAQPVLFAIAVSLAKQWQALGVHPDAVLGDSLGEVAAAYIAGALSLPDAAKVVALRSQAVSAIEAIDATYAAAKHPPGNDISRAAQIDTWAETLREQLSSLDPRTGDVAFISTVTGAGLDTSILNGDYWSANLGQPTLFGHAVRWASEHGYRVFVEVNPYPELTADILESLGGHPVDA